MGSTFSTSSYIGTTTESRCGGVGAAFAGRATSPPGVGSNMVVLQLARGRARRARPGDGVRDRGGRERGREREEVDRDCGRCDLDGRAASKRGAGPYARLVRAEAGGTLQREHARE